MMTMAGPLAKRRSRFAIIFGPLCLALACASTNTSEPPGEDDDDSSNDGGDAGEGAQAGAAGMAGKGIAAQLELDLSKPPACSLYSSVGEVEGELLRPSCAQPSCHSKGPGDPKPEFPPDFERNPAGVHLLDAPLDFNSQCPSDLKLIDSGNPDASFLLLKVAGGAEPMCAPGVAAGARMPQNEEDALTPAQQECVRWYIHQVAAMGGGGAGGSGGAGGGQAAGGSGGAANGAVASNVIDPVTKKPFDENYLKVQPIFKRSCTLSGCHSNGPRCPQGKPTNPDDASQCADPNKDGTLEGLDLSDASALARTAINVDAYHSVLLRTCGTWLNDQAPKLSVKEGSRIKRIVPGDPKNSYVVMKLRKVTEAFLATQNRTLRDADRGQDTDVTRCHGFLMPRSEALKNNPEIELTKQDVELIRNWIKLGAHLWVP
jgi:hypothetical protein